MGDDVLTAGERELLGDMNMGGAAVPTRHPGRPRTDTPGKPALAGGSSPSTTPSGPRRNWQAPTLDGRDVIPRIKVNAGNDASGNPRRHNHWINAGLDG